LKYDLGGSSYKEFLSFELFFVIQDTKSIFNPAKIK